MATDADAVRETPPTHCTSSLPTPPKGALRSGRQIITRTNCIFLSYMILMSVPPLEGQTQGGQHVVEDGNPTQPESAGPDRFGLGRPDAGGVGGGWRCRSPPPRPEPPGRGPPDPPPPPPP